MNNKWIAPIAGYLTTMFALAGVGYAAHNWRTTETRDVDTMEKEARAKIRDEGLFPERMIKLETEYNGTSFGFQGAGGISKIEAFCPTRKACRLSYVGWR